MRYRAFRTKKDNQFYFQFMTEGGEEVLKSQAYSSKADCFTGIKSVIANASNPDRYEAITNEDGTFAFILKAGNHQEIARSVSYDSEDAMKKMMALFQKEGPDASSRAAKAKASAPKKGSQRGDDYRPLAFYQERISGVEHGFDHFADSDKEEYYFTYNVNGEIVLISEGYNSEKGRDNGIKSVSQNMSKPDRYKFFVHDNGKHFFSLFAGNHQEIATSRWCDTEDEAKTYVMALVNNDPSVLPTAKVKAAPMAADSGHDQDDYLDCDAYTGAAGFHTFEKDGKFYFAYNGSDGKTILRSQGYLSAAARDNGIESVKKNGPIEKRWTSGQDNGAWYYALKAGNHQEIARSCDYASEPDMKAGYAAAWNAFEEKPEPVKASAPATAAIQDDYMPCEAYKGEAGFYSFFDENRQEYFFAYNDENGNTLLRSEGYKSAAARDNGIESVKKNAGNEARWKKETALNGKYHYYVLKAANHQEIARSCYYEDEATMSAHFGLLGAAFAAGAGATVVSSMTTEESTTSKETVKAAAPPKKQEKEDDYLPCKEYEGRPVNDKQNNVALFKHENGLYYFALYRADGSVRLRSEGFETAEGRDQELSGVLKYHDNKEMYSRIERGDYFIEVLKDKTGREVGRSCLQKVAPPPPPPPKEKEDDYLKCKEYANRKVNDKQNNVVMFKHDNGQYYFAIYNDDGTVRLRSEGFPTAQRRDDELSGALKNLNNPDMYETIRVGKYYINVLKDKTGREVGRSCMQKERVAPVPPVVVSTSSSSSTVVAGGVASGLAAGGASKLIEKVEVPPEAEKPAAPVAKEFDAPPPPPEKVKVVAAAPVPPAAAASGGGFKWWWLLPLLLIPLFFLLRGCDGCSKTPPPPPPPPVVDTVKQETPPPPKKTALCPAAGDLKLAAGTGANVAAYLSDPESTYPKRFTFKKVGFGKNAARLGSAGRKALDDLVVCLKGCDNTTVDIYGYITERENSSYRGSKEVSLDDVRARAVYDYLRKRGISADRMSFQGEGTGDNNNIVIQLDKS